MRHLPHNNSNVREDIKMEWVIGIIVVWYFLFRSKSKCRKTGVRRCYTCKDWTKWKNVGNERNKHPEMFGSGVWCADYKCTVCGDMVYDHPTNNDNWR